MSAPEILNTLATATAALKGLDLTTLDGSALVPLIKAVQEVCAAQAAVHAEIERRAIGEGITLPGVVVKPAVVQRKWNDAEVASNLAFQAFGLKAFKLDSPAGIEKLGDEGKALVAIASFKPEAGKKVSY